MAILSQRLKSLRVQHNMKQKDLAELLGVSTRAIAYYESGDRDLDYKQIIQLAKTFGVTTDYLVGLSDIPFPLSEKILNFINQTADPDELITTIQQLAQSVNNSQTAEQSDQSKIYSLIKELDEESMIELHKFIRYLQTRQTLSSGSDESSGGLGGKKVK